MGECWASTRIAPPPRSGPFVAQVLRTKTDRTTLSRPPSAKIAPPPLDPGRVAGRHVGRVRRVAVSEGDVLDGDLRPLRGVQAVAGHRSQRRVAGVGVEDRCALPPDNVTLPPPSMTSFWVLLRTFSVWVSVIVTGSGPQLKVITPPAVTAATNAADVQLGRRAGPDDAVGRADVLEAHAGGTVAVPFGLPGLKAGIGLGVAVVKPASVTTPELPAASVERTWKR